MTANPTTVQETLDIQSLKLSERELTNINERIGCDEKNEDVPEEVMSVNFTLKELSVLFHDTESTKCKMSEGDETEIEAWRFAVAWNIFAPWRELGMRRQARFKLFLISFHKEIEHFNSQ